MSHIYGTSPESFPEVAAGNTQYGQLSSGVDMGSKLHELVARFESDYDEELGLASDVERESESVDLLPEVEQFLHDVARHIDLPDDDEPGSERV